MEREQQLKQYAKAVKKVLVSEAEIKSAIQSVAKTIDDMYDGRPIVLVSVLTGSFVFMADLCRAVTVPCEIAFMATKSYYDGTQSSGQVTITMDLQRDIKNCHVVVVEDVIDTGRTLKDVVDILQTRAPASLRVITLLDKPSRRVVNFQPDVALFTIPDVFAVGYGLDCAEKYRHLPYVAQYTP